MSIRHLALLVLLACTTACVMGPDYEQPVVEVPDVWQSKAVEGIEEGQATIQTWWNNLEDDVLIDLLKRAQTANLDLEIALARIREARASYRIAKGAWSPEIDAQGNMGAQQLSEAAFGPLGGQTVLMPLGSTLRRWARLGRRP